MIGTNEALILADQLGLLSGPEHFALAKLSEVRTHIRRHLDLLGRVPSIPPARRDRVAASLQILLSTEAKWQVRVPDWIEPSRR